MSDPMMVISQLLSPAQADSLAATAAGAWQSIAKSLGGLAGGAPGLGEVEGRLAMPEELLGEFGEPHLVLPFELTTALEQAATAYAVTPTLAAAAFFGSIADDPIDQEQQTMVVAGTMLGQVIQALNAGFLAAMPAGVAVALDDMAPNAMPQFLSEMDEPALVLTATLQGARPLPFTLLLPGTFLDILAQASPADVIESEGVTASAPEVARPAFSGIDPSLGFTLSAEDIERAQLIDEPAPIAEPVLAGARDVPPAPPPPAREPTPIAAAKARFAPLSEPERPASRSPIDLLAGLTMNVSVELGRTELTVADVLGLGPGSVVELDRLAGEPVDILVNDRLIARGEVVVVDENFGVRVVEVVRRGQEQAEDAE